MFIIVILLWCVYTLFLQVKARSSEGVHSAEWSEPVVVTGKEINLSLMLFPSLYSSILYTPHYNVTDSFDCPPTR